MNYQTLLASLLLSLIGATPVFSHIGGHQSSLPKGVPSPAELLIARAEAALAKHPEQPTVHSDLAMAYAARAREIADASYYDRAMKSVGKSLDLQPNNFAAKKAEAWITLGQHDFRRALEQTRELAKRMGDDPMIHAMRTDAAIESGNYDEAEEAAQWALDLDPGGSPGLTRAAYMREHFGDFSGAIELMGQALNRTLATDTETRAWIMTHIGHLHLLNNDLEAAEQAQMKALELFPDYHYALKNLGELRTVQGKNEEALDLYRRLLVVAPHAEGRFEFAKAAKRLGKTSEAAEAFARFEKDALAKSGEKDNANQELVAYYLDVAKSPAEALRIAELEMGNRHDFRTRAAHARALHANGKTSEAYEEMKKTLDIGVRYPELQFHAGIIARDAGDTEAAVRYFKQSLEQQPGSPVSATVRSELKVLLNTEDSGR